MKLFSYTLNNSNPGLGVVLNGDYYSVESLCTKAKVQLPTNMLQYLQAGEGVKIQLEKICEKLNELNVSPLNRSDINLSAPIPNPPSCRDAYAFRQHVETARRNRGVPMIPEFDEFPVFYFTNHNAIIGPGDVVLEKDHFEKLDFELELAVVIGKKGRNIKADEADQYIAGFTIMNDLSARFLQMQEMKLNLGPAKGKDFATAIGPYLATADELSSFSKSTPKGLVYDLNMKAEHNGHIISRGNSKDMHWTFAEIIERCSYGVDILPGDVIGSGTVGTGCYLELNGTEKWVSEQKGSKFTPTWLLPNDEITLSIDGLGTLNNKMVLSENNVSILEKNQKVEQE